MGIRLSFDGIAETHDRIRGVKGMHGKALETLKGLKGLGIKDLGIAVTISDENANDLVPLYRLAENGVELATAILHNAYYFHKEDNVIADKVWWKRYKEADGRYLYSSHPKTGSAPISARDHRPHAWSREVDEMHHGEGFLFRGSLRIRSALQRDGLFFRQYPGEAL